MKVTYIIDTSALVEYLKGTEKGLKIKQIIEDGTNDIAFPSVVLAELVSKLEREGKDGPGIAMRLLDVYGRAMEMEAYTSINAGSTHAKLRKIEKGISLIDCIIMELAEENDAYAVTTDDHFKYYKKSIIF